MLPSAAKLTLLTKDITKLKMDMMWHYVSKHLKHQNGPMTIKSRVTVRCFQVFTWSYQKATMKKHCPDHFPQLRNQKSPQSSSSIRPILGVFRLSGWEDPWRSYILGSKYEKNTRSPPQKSCWFAVWTIEASSKLQNLDTSFDVLQVTWFFLHVESSSDRQMESGISQKMRNTHQTSTLHYAWFHVSFLAFCWFSSISFWRVPDF